MTISDTLIPPYMLEKLCDYYAMKKEESDSKQKASEISWADKWELQRSTLQTLFQRQNTQKDKDADTKEKRSLPTSIKFKIYSFSDDDVADTSNLMTDPDVIKISSHMKRIYTFYGVYGDALGSDFAYGLDNTMRVFLHAFKTTSYNNAFWSPVTRSVYYGDCDSEIFNPLINYPEIACHLFTKGYLQFFSHLVYEGQSGALLESLGDVFGVTLSQKEAGQKANEADWLIGKDLLKPHGPVRHALRSLKAPGTAYFNHPIFGTDPQRSSMRFYFDRNEDNKGVHYNSGIPNHAYYLAATNLQGYSFEKPMLIWFAAISQMKPSEKFLDFANSTIAHAKKLFGENEANEVRKAWYQVDVLQKTERERKHEAERLEAMRRFEEDRFRAHQQLSEELATFQKAQGGMVNVPIITAKSSSDEIQALLVNEIRKRQKELSEQLNEALATFQKAQGGMVSVPVIKAKSSSDEIQSLLVNERRKHEKELSDLHNKIKAEESERKRMEERWDARLSTLENNMGKIAVASKLYDPRGKEVKNYYPFNIRTRSMAAAAANPNATAESDRFKSISFPSDTTLEMEKKLQKANWERYLDHLVARRATRVKKILSKKTALVDFEEPSPSASEGEDELDSPTVSEGAAAHEIAAAVLAASLSHRKT